MDGILAVAAQNLLTPMVLFFALGFGAALLRSDLSISDTIARALAMYLMLAIGFKGGSALARQGLSDEIVSVVAAGAALSFAIPLVAFALLRAVSRLNAADAAATAAHYGSISVVTFVAANEFLNSLGIKTEGYMVAVMAIMETPAIVSGLWLAQRFASSPDRRDDRARRRAALSGELVREVFLNGSVVLLLGALAIGWATGQRGYEALAPFIDAPFKGVLCLFLLDMGLVAARRLSEGRELSSVLVGFALVMPLIGAAFGLLAATVIGLGVGETALFATLCASASYIAVPAAMRLALPEASPGVYLTLSLAVTFPFNGTLGIPIYLAAARWAVG